MKQTALFLVAFVVGLASASIDFNVTIPGGQVNVDVNLDQLKKFVEAQLDKLGLTDPAEKEQLINDLKDFIVDFPLPPLKPSDILRPSKWIAYMRAYREHVTKAVSKVLEKAREILREKLGLVSERALPSLSELLENFNFPGMDFITNTFDKIKDFVKEQLSKLGLDKLNVDSLLDTLKGLLANIPRPNLSDLLNPTKWMEVIKQFQQRVAEAVQTVVQKAKELLGGMFGERIAEEEERLEIPSIVDLISNGKDVIKTIFDNIKEIVRKQLEKLGISDPEAQKQLLDQLKDYLQTFPLPSLKPLDFLNPVKWLQYATALNEHVTKGLEKVFETAKVIAGNLIEDIILPEERIELPSLSELFNSGQNLLNKIFEHIQEFVAQQIEKLGVNDPEVKQKLIDELKQYINDFPMPPLGPLDFINPIKWFQYVSVLQAHVDKAVKRVLETAKVIAGNVIEDIKNRPSNRIALPSVSDILSSGQSVLTKIFEEIKAFVQKQIEKLGINDPEVKQQLLAELKQYIDEFPLPSLKPIDIINPIKWIQYMTALQDHVDKAVQRVIETAMKIAGNVIDEVLKPGQQVERFEMPNIVEIISSGKDFLTTIFEHVKEFVRGQLRKLGLDDPAKQEELLDDLKTFIAEFPAPPTGINPFKWIQYVQDLEAHLTAGYVYITEKAKVILGSL